jgi:type 2 lantibiotic biosynthesis protein LanM
MADDAGVLMRAAPGGAHSDLQALFLHELLQLAPAQVPSIVGPDLMDHWQQGFGLRGFERRMNWVSATPLSTMDWRGLLEAACGREHFDALPPTEPLPFDDILRPLAGAAWDAFEQRVGSCANVMSSAARSAMARSLVALLSHLAAPTLGSEFALHKALSGQAPWQVKASGTDAYSAFVRQMQAGDFRSVLHIYPGLARLLATAALHWAQAAANIVLRLVRDWPDLCSAFDLSGTGPQVVDVIPYCSDPHDGGQTVCVLTLPDNRRLVYKPRGIEMEQGLSDVLAWANQSGVPWPFRTVTVLCRTSYGWTDYVTSAPCQDMAGVDRFYLRSGALFALCWLLQATDIHHENIIAAGEQPVIVDAETLLHPRPFEHVARVLGPGTERNQSQDDFARALAESGFLPSGRSLDFPAWVHAPRNAASILITRTVNANSDAMAVVETPVPLTPRENLPVLDGKPQHAGNNIPQILCGFETILQNVLSDRLGFLDVVQRFAGREGRFVARSSHAYGALLNRSFRPEWLRAGAGRGIHYDQLRHAAVSQVERPACWGLFDAELSALENMDVPRFSCRCDQPSDLWDPPLGQVIDRIANLSALDLPVHVAALHRALAALDPENGSHPSG